MFLKPFAGIALLLILLCVASCAHTSSSAFQAGKEQQGQKEYAAAIASYTRAISEKKGSSLLSAAYFYRGECYERTKKYAEAYRDFYTARQLSCRIINTDKASNTNTTALGVVAQSSLCNEYGPQAMARVESKLESAQIEQIRNEVDTHITAQ